jgi:RecJ-like exonuclease
MRGVGISAEYRPKKHVYDMSLRSRDTVDLNMVLRKVAPKFGGTGGGHASAAGARIPRESFEDFLYELDKTISREKHNAQLIENGEK